MSVVTRRHVVVTIILATILVVGLFSGVSHAATTTRKGLFLSPPRNFAEIDAGKTTQGPLVIANYTDSPLAITLSVEEFSVADLSYTYIFRDAKENWLHFSQTSVQLDPGKDEKITYTVTPPANMAPGGKYYTIVASTTIVQGGISSKVQVAVPLYITVKGLTTQTNKLVSHTLFSFAMGDHIPFSLDIADTGNIHYLATATGSLSGPWTNKSTVTATHILLPGTTRRIAESIPSPPLPGIYKVTYGYSTDTSKPVMVEGIVVYTPPWFYVVAAGAGWGIYVIVRRYRRVKAHRTSSTTASTSHSPQQPYK